MEFFSSNVVNSCTNALPYWLTLRMTRYNRLGLLEDITTPNGRFKSPYLKWLIGNCTDEDPIEEYTIYFRKHLNHWPDSLKKEMNAGRA